MSGEQGNFRIYGYLPVGKLREKRAAGAVLSWLRHRFGGYTASNIGQASYQGFYRRADGSWCRDPVSVVFVDDTFADLGSLHSFTEDFCAEILASYARFQSRQDEVMVTAIAVASIRSLMSYDRA
jgi:hypothetical protein